MLAVFFVGAGANHFLAPEFYLRIMPPYLPAPSALVYLSGAWEIAGGLGVLVPRARRRMGWALILLLILVFPANIHMAMHPDLYAAIPRWVLYLRLPLQPLLGAWVYWATRR